MGVVDYSPEDYSPGVYILFDFCLCVLIKKLLLVIMHCLMHYLTARRMQACVKQAELEWLYFQRYIQATITHDSVCRGRCAVLHIRLPQAMTGNWHANFLIPQGVQHLTTAQNSIALVCCV